MIKKIIAFNLLIAYVTTTACESSLSSLSSWFFNSAQKTYNQTFQATPNTSLTLDNLQGSITVRTWSEPKVALDATISGKEKDINGVTIVAQTTAEDVITIRTQQPPDGKNKVSVDYTLIIPYEMAAELSTHNGNISVTEARSSLQSHTDNGSTSISYSYLPPEAIVQVTADNGPITLALPSAANAHVAAKTEKGSITTQQTVLLKPQLTQLGRNAWKQFKQQAFFDLGQGGATISLFAKNGTIKITEL